MQYYQYHVFFCTNQREGGRQCCAGSGSIDALHYAKTKIKALNLNGKGQIRINSAGCMDRCVQGPALVIYPDGIWYQYKNLQDIDEIIEEHLLHGRVVTRLLI